jgi:hypothetical protein
VTAAPRTLPEALAFARSQRDHPTQNWHALCQSFVRQCWGIPALFSSAYAQWVGADEADKHRGGSPDDAPMGAALCFKGSNPFGHIDFAAHHFPSGNSAAFSNDLIRDGRIDKVHRSAPTTVWGQTYLGYLTAVNDHDLNLHAATPKPRPKQVRYKAVSLAIDRIDDALTTARKQGDKTDVAAFTAEAARLKALYVRLRRNA